MTLQEFIDKHYQLCAYRGIDPLNPIDFIIQPDADVNQTWTLLCSISEPTFSRVAYNILWMPLNPTDSNYKQILRRVDHERSNMGYKAEWEVISTYEDLWTDVQYWRPVITDPALLGITDLNEGIGPATTTTLGLAYLEPNYSSGEGGINPVQAIAIEQNDVRMSNPRYPNYHTHPDYARSKIKINDTQYALVSTSFPPEPGMLLFLEGINPNNSDEFIAVWRYPRSNDIAFVDRSLLNITIVGPSIVDEQSIEQYEVWATFADNTTRKVTPNSFVITQNSSAATIGVSGVLTTNDIAVNTNIVLEATYIDRGISRSATKPVTIVAGVEVLSIEILGSDEVLEKTTSNAYSVRATFSDGNVNIVTPATFTSSNISLAPLNANRSIVAGNANGDTPITLSATYVFAGKTVSATKQVIIKEEPVVPTSLVILGPSPSTMLEGTQYVFTFRVGYSDGSQVVRNTVTSFTSTNSAVLAVAQTATTATGTAGLVTTNTTVRLNASYQEGGATVNASVDVLVTDVARPTAAEIYNGATTFFENQPQVYRGRIRFDNNTTINVTDSTRTVWSIVTGAAHATLVEHPTDGSATLTPNDITADQTVRIRLVATYNGQDFTVEQNLTIRARLNTPTSLKIFEESVAAANYDSAVTSIDINAGTTRKFKFAAKMSFTPTQWTDISASNVALSFSIANPNHGITVAVDAGDPTKVVVTVPAGLAANQTVQLVATYTNDGSSANASYTINAKAISTDISPRFGLAPMQQFIADYGTPAFYNLLTGSLTGVEGEQFSVGPAADMDNLGYMMYPKSWGFIRIQNVATSEYGSWDGGKVTAQDGTFGSPAEVTVNGKQYYIYRMTFPGYMTGTTWRVVKYNAVSPDSSLP